MYTRPFLRQFAFTIEPSVGAIAGSTKLTERRETALNLNKHYSR
jgi:hypothetical protein